MQNPLIPMVAMTGAPQKDEVFTFVKNMKEKCGFTQLMLYPRTGCEVEYLSEEWFALCSYYLESAAANDMKLWLYDEFNWPAGQAGGRVTAHEAYRLKNLLVKNDGKHVQFDVVLTDYPDILNEEAMNLFLSLTHKEYQKRFGRYFGNTIVGMYTDEPSFGYGTGKERLPYYDGLQEDYRNAYGTDLLSDLESCVTGEKTAETVPVYARLYDLCGKRMHRCFSEKIGTWCETNGLMLTGHLMDDETPAGNTLHTGNALLNLSAFGKPGIDEIGTCIAYGTTTLEWLLPLADAFSVQSRHGAMAELFAFGPYDMSHVKEVQMLALTALHGINTWFLAVGHFDMRGNMAKKRYFRNYTDACPDCEAYKELAHRAEQFALLAAKERACPIRILYDRDRIAEAVGTERLSAENRVYMDLCRALHETQTDFRLVYADDREGKLVFLPEEDGSVRELRTGKCFVNAKDAAKAAQDITPELVRATDQNGNVLADVFMRHFADGSYCLIDVANQSADRYVYVGGAKIFLSACGVYDSSQPPLDVLCQAAVSQSRITLPKTNVFRFLLPSGLKEKTFVCEQDMTVVFALREIHTDRFFMTDGNVRAAKRGELVRGTANGKGRLYLDGKLLSAEQADTFLPWAFGKFYHCTAPVYLAAGTHRVRMENVLDDVKFLPLLLAYGDFAVDYEYTALKAQEAPKPGDAVGFFGEASYTATVTVPCVSQGFALYFGTRCALYKRLFIDGERMGDGGLGNLGLWRIPEKYHGKTVDVTICYVSTLAPLFGDTAMYVRDNTVDAGFWADIARPYRTFALGADMKFYTAKQEDDR